MPRELFSSFFGAGFLQLSCSPLFEDLQVKMNIYENIKVTCFTVQEAFQDSTCWHHPRSPNFCGRGLVWKSRPKIKPDPTRNLSRLTSHSSPIPSECMHYLPFLEFLKSSDHSTDLSELVLHWSTMCIFVVSPLIQVVKLSGSQFPPSPISLLQPGPRVWHWEGASLFLNTFTMEK